MARASIIIPTFDRPHLLSRAVESARAAAEDVAQRAEAQVIQLQIERDIPVGLHVLKAIPVTDLDLPAKE